MRMTVRMPSLSNVAAGGTATLNMPVGRTYDKLTLDYSGIERSQMQNIKLLIDGKPVMEFSDGAELASLNKYYGRHDQAGFLTLWFVRPEMQSLEHQRVTALGTGNAAGEGRIQTLQLEIDIHPDAADPKIKAKAVQSDPKRLGQMTKVKRFSYSSATSGAYEIDNIPKGPRIQAIHFIKEADDINHVEVEQNSRKVVEGEATLLRYMQKESGRTPQSKILSVDFTQEGDIFQTLTTNPNRVQDQRFRLDLATAGAVTVLVEYIDTFAGI
ncbi:major capsid protein P2 [Halomonas sp. SIMBA_159]